VWHSAVPGVSAPSLTRTHAPMLAGLTALRAHGPRPHDLHPRTPGAVPAPIKPAALRRFGDQPLLLFTLRSQSGFDQV